MCSWAGRLHVAGEPADGRWSRPPHGLPQRQGSAAGQILSTVVMKLTAVCSHAQDAAAGIAPAVLDACVRITAPRLCTVYARVNTRSNTVQHTATACAACQRRSPLTYACLKLCFQDPSSSLLEGRILPGCCVEQATSMAPLLLVCPTIAGTRCGASRHN